MTHQFRIAGEHTPAPTITEFRLAYPTERVGPPVVQARLVGESDDAWTTLLELKPRLNKLSTFPSRLKALGLEYFWRGY